MRLLESILILLCAAFTIRLAGIGRHVGGIHAAQALLALMLVMQVVVEGWRWQMFPAYAATLLALVATSNQLALGAQPLFLSSIAIIGLLAASIVFCLALPFVQPPIPQGPFQVGVTASALPVAVSRPPEAVEDELKAKPLVRLWYPAKAGASDRSSPVGSALKPRLSNRFRAQPVDRAVPNAPIAAAATRFPVLIYFDGWPENELNNVNLIMEMVSHGFAVASVQYPARDSGTSDAADALMRAKLSRDMVAYSSDAEFARSVELTHARARVHAQDAIAVLDALAALDTSSSSPFAGRLDTQHTGTLGFSFGGAVAAEASRLDPRIRAVVNMDGRHWSEALYKGVERPYMFISEKLSMPTAADLTSPKGMIRYEALLDQADFRNYETYVRALGGIHISIAGTAHMNFSDIALRSPLRRFSHGGSIDARRAQQIIQTYVVEFFSRNLPCTQQAPLDSPWTRYPEALVQIWPPAP